MGIRYSQTELKKEEGGNRMKTLVFGLLGVLSILGGIAAGVYVGIFLFLVPGIREIVEAVQATPVDGNAVAWAVVKILLTETAAGLTAVGGFLLGVFFFKLASD